MATRVINPFLEFAPASDLPARDDVKRNNTFAGPTSGSQTIAASSQLGASYAPYKAANGVSNAGGSENWLSDGSGLPEWWSIDFGVPQVIYSYSLMSRLTVPYDLLEDWEIQSSDDNSTWVTRDSQAAYSWPASDYTPINIDLDTPAEARYWRILITSTDSGLRCAITEIEWYS